MRRVDVAVIGAGSAGLAAFDEARKTTRRVLLIHDGPDGTTCARVGCMPSKALIQIASDFHRRHALSAEGIAGARGLRVDGRAVMRRVRFLRDGFTAGPAAKVAALGRCALAGHARFIEPTVLQVGARTIRAESVVVAVGSRPIVPAAWEALRPDLVTSDQLFELETLPASMAVLGLGGIGVEMAQALARLGVRVVGIGRSRFLGVLSDPDVNRRMTELLGLELRLWLGSDGKVESSGGRLKASAAGRAATLDKILASLGRRPNVAGLDLKNLGLPLSADGLPDFDPATRQVGTLPVFIAGDAGADRPVLHEALESGRVAGFNAAARRPKRFSRHVPLDILFCDPNIAVVGSPWSSLKGRGVRVGRFDFRRQGRAVLQSRAEGLLNVYGDPRTGRLLGAELAAPGGEHLAQLLASALQRRLTVFQALAAPVYHPTLEEGLRDALRDLARKIR
ncbi:MAG: dihydrolipoyl dehydrogenase [Elusimicrobia bacterium]|nr:dihydrolipoyl dehydrogenase [Elusimicrobiota bacterium]